MTWARRRAAVEAWLAPSGSPTEAARLLTLVLLLYHAVDSEFPFMVFHPISAAVLIAGILWPQLRSSRLFWAYLTMGLVWARLPGWLTIDNHQYLIAWWSLAVFASLLARPRDPDAFIASNARWLVGLAMGFAVFAKLRAPGFADGSFFEFLLLGGARFEAFATIVAGIPLETLAANRHALASMLGSGVGGPFVRAIALEGGGDWMGVLALLLALWTLAIEGAVAILFLVPSKASGVRVARNVSLLTFAVTTYAVATVGSFAWILIILGLAQCDEDDAWSRLAYGVAFLLVLVYVLPFGVWLGALGGWSSG